MALKDLFKSDGDRRRDRQRRRNRAVRNAERQIDKLESHKRELRRDRQRTWGQAVETRSAGSKAEAQMLLRTVQSIDQHLSKTHMRQSTFQEIVRTLRYASVDEDLGIALRDVTEVLEVDPEQLEEDLSGSMDKTMEILAMDRVWERYQQKQLDGLEAAEGAPMAISELEKQLEAEVADRATTVPQNADPNLAQDISDGRERLRKAMEETK